MDITSDILDCPACKGKSHFGIERYQDDTIILAAGCQTCKVFVEGVADHHLRNPFIGVFTLWNNHPWRVYIKQLEVK